MRQLPERSTLPKALVDRLKRETIAISSHGIPQAEARRIYSNARQAVWFKPVVKALKILSGSGQRCMFCSGSEAADIEHYKPKKVFPNLAMSWRNFIWSCTPCNREKGHRFPPYTEAGGLCINPLEENVWAFFFMDKYGLLTPRYDRKTRKFNMRAVTTRDLLDLNREAVQESRKQRIDDLKSRMDDNLKLLKIGKISKSSLRIKVENWRKQAYQLDVADYFLNGPGKAESPFKEFLSEISE